MFWGVFMQSQVLILKFGKKNIFLVRKRSSRNQESNVADLENCTQHYYADAASIQMKTLN